MPAIDLLNPYAYVMRIRRVMYERGWLKSFHPAVPVISVGNLTVGGTGKSPMVLAITSYLERKHGKRVAIVSRGYRRKSKGFVLVRDGSEILASVEETGDEAQMFAECSPNTIVIVDEDRAHGAREAHKLGAEVIVLDDAYQHLRIRRDLNILLTASSQYPPVIPFGRSREPASAARAADVVVASNGTEAIAAELQQHLRDDTVICAVQQRASSLLPLNGAPELALSELKDKRVLAVSSIAAPLRFRDMLQLLGATVIEYQLGDHAEYSEAVVGKILQEASKSNAQLIVTTHKDAVKAKKYYRHVQVPTYVLAHELEFLNGEERFYQAIDRIL